MTWNRIPFFKKYEHQIETLRTQPASTKVSTPAQKSPLKDSSSSSGSSTPTKPQESSIAEDLPASTTPSQSKNEIVVSLFTLIFDHDLKCLLAETKSSR